MGFQGEIDAISFNKELSETYKGYLFTSNMVSDKEAALRDAFFAKLGNDYSIIKGPYIHATPSYRWANTLRELVDGKGTVRLSRQMLNFPKEFFDPDRPLYKHQVESINALKESQNVVIATGTGSGKTESYLLPIIDSVLEDPSPGLRAIIIYPLNALADDQLFRFRKLLAAFPQVTFGRYTGATLAIRKGEKEGPENEREDRRELRDDPPHILLTNFAMLEYLLLRPQDSSLFSNHHLKFLVLDEAHVYTGAQGIEVSLLMRRLKEYLFKDKGNLQFILTSATIGGGDDAKNKIARFASDLTGSSFTSDSVITGETVHSFSNAPREKPSLPELVKAVGRDDFSKWETALSDEKMMMEMLIYAGFSISDGGKGSVAKILFAALHDYAPLANIHDYCKSEPAEIAELAEKLALAQDDLACCNTVRWLVTMGAYGRKGQGYAPLLPTRLHFFCRGLSGATVCLNEACDAKASHPNTGWSDFFLEDRTVCDCGAEVLPLLTCVHCGFPVIKVYDVDGNWKKHQYPEPDIIPRIRLLTWSEDIDASEQDEMEEDSERSDIFTLCLACKSIAHGKVTTGCCDKKLIRYLYSIEPDEKGHLPKCPSCGGSKGSFDSVLREFRTSEDAPTAVLAETTIRNLPFENNSERSRLPANGRNLLVFSDSRQRAAFFAPYLLQTTAETAYMGPLEKAIERAEEREGRPVSFDEVAQEYERRLSEMDIIVVRKREDDNDYYELVPKAGARTQQRSDAKKEAERTLYRHFCSSNKQKTTMQGMGIASLCIDFTEEERNRFQKEIPELFSDGLRKGMQAIQALIDVFVQKKAVDFPDYVMVNPDIVSYGAELYTFHLADGGKRGNRQVLRWNPYRAADRSRKNAVRLSRQLDLLCKILRLDKNRDSEKLEELMTRIWDSLKDGLLVEKPSFPGEYRINKDCLQLTKKATWFSCSRCGRVTSLGELAVCTMTGCDGQLMEMTENDLSRKFGLNHYRKRYNLSALPLQVKEHTAQLTNECGREYQKAFMEGKVNVLSSSTTFEMGIDVGHLKAVMLRNVPPTTSSYIQRAGRAGRRQDGISLAITYARNVPHDQYHYQNPEDIILGKIPVPYINTLNVPLAQRHCNSMLLGYFFRNIRDVDAGSLDSPDITEFFLQEHNGKTLVHRFAEWVSNPANRARMILSLKAILPEKISLTSDDALENSVKMLYSNEDSVFNLHVQQQMASFDEQITSLNKAIAVEANIERRRKLENSRYWLEKLRDQFKDQRLIDFLSSCAWLPGYAFPQDIVKLTVRHPNYLGKMRLERDREIGISEYAPGAAVIADGKVFKSAGVSFNSREPEIRWYLNCTVCRKIETGLYTEKAPHACPACGRHYNLHPRKYIKPEGFTTKIDDEPKMPQLNRVRPPRSSEIFLLDGAENFTETGIAGISYGVKEGGKLFKANSGYGFSGFLLCEKCGRHLDSRPKGKGHETCWGSTCGGTLSELDLAHEIVTDILQLRFNRCVPPPPDTNNKPFWLSLVSAFLNGTCDSLGISPNDLGGTYHGWTAENHIGELVLYDRIPGGAGHIRQIIENLDLVLKKTLERVRDCACSDIEGSCYACLRSYSNQFYWDHLKRRPIIEWLEKIIEK